MKRILKTFFILLIIVVVIVILTIGYFFIGKAKIQDKIVWGVNFSQSQAEYLELDWKEAYLAVIKDLGVKNIKLHVNWSWVERKFNDFYFDDIDWQIYKAEQNNVKIVYVLGMKTGRWPECHISDWSKDVSEDQVKSELLNYITQTVRRYKNSKAIDYWQVENEPLFRFGECPRWYYKNKDFLKQEIALIKELDPSRQIIISDSGEQSMWFGPARIGDIVGVTTYRMAWVNIGNMLGFNVYFPLTPIFYSKKADLIKKFFDKKVIGVELQAEPWMSHPIMEASLEEQLKSMNLELFKNNIEFAKNTGFDTFYFWGVEWWYYMKEKQNYPEIWNKAKEIL